MKRILFVDDEEAALDGLRYRLHRMSSQWQIECVDSGPRAIERMEGEPYDVVVTDMRMPGMDGAELLEIVSNRWSQAIRIVLSGYADLRQTIRLVPFAHQYLSKPCEPKLLEDVINRCLTLQDLLNGSELRALVGRIRKLPAIPRIYSALQAMTRDENVTAAQIASLIATDSAIAARVLQIVNSAFFRLARRITNIEQAVSYLGFTAIRNVATSVEIFSQWPTNARSHLDQEALQAHVRTVAAAASALTSKSQIADDTMLAGLLHDIGYWVLAQECSADLGKAIELSASAGIPLHEAETRLMGASHAEVGAYLLGIWGLPYPVIEAVAHHHQPQRVTQSDFDVLAALAIAHSLAQVDDSSAFDLALPPDPKVDERYLASLKAPYSWNEAERRVAATVELEEVSP
ncbi:MAG TPA: response regulator [Steroidobacteraceae bacterium]|jgi:HD-like signal output (HDOD) protein/ActR/RegA family two-component response regulator